MQQNLSTALIMEDDFDFDIRLRQQLGSFALASQWLTRPTSTTAELSRLAIQTIKNPETEESIHNESSPNPISETLYSVPVSTLPQPQPFSLQASPYGSPENWDVLWLGHCGAGFPRYATSPLSNLAAGKHNIVLAQLNDDTVPSPQHLKAHPFGPLDALAESHEPHTRVYHRASGGALCTVAYAVSQRGARRLLLEFGVKRWSRSFDVEMGSWCAGEDSVGGKGDGKETDKRGERVCITSQPPVLAHHHPDGGESDIGGLGGGYARSVETKYVRKSVRMNLEALVRGDGEEAMVDQWPD